MAHHLSATDMLTDTRGVMPAVFRDDTAAGAVVVAAEQTGRLGSRDDLVDGDGRRLVCPAVIDRHAAGGAELVTIPHDGGTSVEDVAAKEAGDQRPVGDEQDKTGGAGFVGQDVGETAIHDDLPCECASSHGPSARACAWGSS